VLKMVNDTYQWKIFESDAWTWLARRKMWKTKKKGLCLVFTTMVFAIWNERSTRAWKGRENDNSNSKGNNTYYYK